jgi:hypothetical protein
MYIIIQFFLFNYFISLQDNFKYPNFIDSILIMSFLNYFFGLGIVRLSLINFIPKIQHYLTFE